jgi:U32 family peptidase
LSHPNSLLIFVSLQEKYLKTSVEILAPAGTWETLHAAIQGGADSVYFGVGHLNMRSRSSLNFTTADIEKIVRICSEGNVKTYVTVNTVIYDDEIAEMQALIEKLAVSGIDAVIASDFSVIEACHRHGIPVHASTQLNISNLAAVKFFSQFCDVMVLARELNLKQVGEIIGSISKQHICGPSGHPVRIEIFAHGALCMAISGKCYLSLDQFNLSANRGACIQICRRGYRVEDIDKQVELEIDNEYIMSPKDLKTLDFLDVIIQAGVSVLKIEGRARSAEYVKTVTKVYKDAVHSIHEGTFTKENKQHWNEQLKSVFHRGFWDGYYLGRKMGEWAEFGGSQSTKTREYVGKITNYFSKLNVMEISLESGQLSIGDEILIIGNTTGVVEMNIPEIRVNLQPVQTAMKGDVTSVPLNELVRRNDKVYKLVRGTVI